MNAAMAAAAVIGLYLLLWIFAKPVKELLKILFKGALGSAALFALNTVLAPTGFFIGINPVTYLMCGLLGVNGFLALIGIRFIV